MREAHKWMQDAARCAGIPGVQQQGASSGRSGVQQQGASSGRSGVQQQDCSPRRRGSEYRAFPRVGGPLGRRELIARGPRQRRATLAQKQTLPKDTVVPSFVTRAWRYLVRCVSRIIDQWSVIDKFKLTTFNTFYCISPFRN
jgi:hypothetical protein